MLGRLFQLLVLLSCLLLKHVSECFYRGFATNTPKAQHLLKAFTTFVQTPIQAVMLQTVDDLLITIQEKLKGKSFDAIIHVMAVLDYSPEKQSEGKIASIKDTLTITLLKTPKVIKQILALWPDAFLIGFKLAVGLSKDELMERAYASIIESMADLVVANNQDEIAEDKHRAYLINANKEIEYICETRQDISNNLTKLIGTQISCKAGRIKCAR